ncbi:MAG: lysostaphin resistance A-like protein [Vicinamibacterales bacterium]
MSRGRFLLAGLAQLLIGAAVVQAAMVLFRFALHPAVVSALALGPPAASATRRLGVFAAAVGSYWAFGRWYERRPVPELRLDWRWILAGAVAGSLSIGTPIALLYASGHYQLTSVRGLDGVGDVLFVILVAAVIEEVTFRGLLFRILEQRLGTRLAVVVSAAVFSVAHYANNGFTTTTLIAVVLTGVMWSGVYMTSRSLWVTAAHHCCWNATIFLTGLPLSGQDEWRRQAPFVSDYHGSVLWSGGAFGPEDSLLSIGLCGVLCIALWRLAQAMDSTVPRPSPTASLGA